MLDNPNSDWKNNYLIYLKGDVDIWDNKLDDLGINCSRFYEPDLSNKLTAIAVVSDGKVFKHLSLVK